MLNVQYASMSEASSAPTTPAGELTDSSDVSSNSESSDRPSPCTKTSDDCIHSIEEYSEKNDDKVNDKDDWASSDIDSLNDKNSWPCRSENVQNESFIDCSDENDVETETSVIKDIPSNCLSEDKLSSVDRDDPIDSKEQTTSCSSINCNGNDDLIDDMENSEPSLSLEKKNNEDSIINCEETISIPNNIENSDSNQSLSDNEDTIDNTDSLENKEDIEESKESSNDITPTIDTDGKMSTEINDKESTVESDEKMTELDKNETESNENTIESTVSDQTKVNNDINNQKVPIESTDPENKEEYIAPKQGYVMVPILTPYYDPAGKKIYLGIISCFFVSFSLGISFSIK